MIEECIASGCWSLTEPYLITKLLYAQNFLTGAVIGSVSLFFAYMTKGRYPLMSAFLLSLGLCLAIGAYIIGTFILHI